MQESANKISARQERAITALIFESTVSDAAKAAGCNESTIHRWRQEPAFAAAFRRARQEYRKTRQELGDQALALLHEAAKDAVAVLKQIMADTDAKASARVAAAKTILAMATAGPDDESEELLAEARRAKEEREASHEAK